MENDCSYYLADYIRPAIDKKYRTRSDAADDLGIDQAVLSRICSGKRFGISEHLVENICLRLQLDTAEGLLRLFLSKNPKIKQHFFELTKEISVEIVHPSAYKPAGQPNKLLSEEYAAVPFVSSSYLNGKKISGKAEKVEYSLVPKSFLSKKGDFVAYKVKTDSMSPTLPNGSEVVVDLGDTRELHGSIYLYKHNNEVNIGRASLQDNFLQISPDNKDRNKFPSCIYDTAKSRKDNPILGKIVFTLKKL